LNWSKYTTNLAYEMTTIMSAGSTLAGVTPEHRQLAVGDRIFSQGDRTFGIFHVANGRIRLQRITADGSTVTIHLARAGEMFAEASLFSEHYHCDAVAETESQILIYPKAEITSRLRAEPEALWQFARELASRLQGMRTRFEIKQIRSAPERVLQWLRMRSGEDGVIRVPGAAKDIASEVGLTHEAFYRALAALEKQGRIARSTGAIRLIGRRA
jgi:CRP/FNR family transcriptional regulator, dissimilatory nitrate respiration regulator